MSLNLVGWTGKEEIPFRQTPTWVTIACLTDENGETGERTGIAAKRGLQIYFQWVLSLAEAYGELDYHKNHIAEIKEMVRGKKLRLGFI